MANLAKSAGDMCNSIEAYTNNTTTGNALAYLNSGYDRFRRGANPADPTASSHDFSWLRPETSFVLFGSPSGTISAAITYDGVTYSTLTVASATFNAAMVGQVVKFTTTTNTYTIAAYVSPTSITVAGNASAETGDFTILCTISGSITYAALTGLSTATATTACFYPSMVGRTMTFVTTGNAYVVAGYTSATVVTLTGDAHTESGLFSVTCDGSFALPDDYSGMVGTPVFVHACTYSRTNLERTTATRIDVERRRRGSRPGHSRFWSIEVRGTPSTGQRWNLLVEPPPTSDMVVTLRYRIEPQPLTDASTCYALGMPEDALTIEYAGLAEAELKTGKVNGPMEARYKELMIGSIERDYSLHGDADACIAMSDVP
jgi:hypothetical protein